jgi:hypothetical protein
MSPSYKHILLAILIAVVLGACIEPYQPTDTLNAPDILVFDGSINSSGQSATLRITHAVPLSSIGAPPAESSATVTIDQFDGGSYQLAESEPGYYSSVGLSFDITKKYRLNVKTKAGKIYQSGYIELYESPPIDSVTWRTSTEGIEILVNTHDDTKRSQYYEWKFVETWKYTATYFSSYIFDDGNIYLRTLDDYNYTCYRTEPSTDILVSTTTQLSSDVVRDRVVATIPSKSWKISQGYTILVEQSVLSEEAYNYWSQLKKTTEDLGGLFDPMPARVTGNITCISDTSEPVLGYFRGGNTTEKRLWIHTPEIPTKLRYVPPFGDCVPDSIPFENMPTSGQAWIISMYGSPFAEGYLLSSYACTDCRAHKGVLEVPDFWEE